MKKVIGNLIEKRSSPSADRFLGVFSPPSSSDWLSGDELNEDDVFWTGDFTEKKFKPESRKSAAIEQPEKFGILAALSDDSRRPVLYRKSSISPEKSSASRLIPSIPKPEYEFKKFQQSVPVNVPSVGNKLRNFDLADAVDVEIDEDDEMLPPHEIDEIVAKGFRSPKTFSVLEGVGRTLKGRDLRQVRNAVWRKTGFLDS